MLLKTTLTEPERCDIVASSKLIYSLLCSPTPANTILHDVFAAVLTLVSPCPAETMHYGWEFPGSGVYARVLWGFLAYRVGYGSMVSNVVF
jgi:hypothetical protein